VRLFPEYPLMALNVIHGAAKVWSLSDRINSGQTAPSGLTGSATFDPGCVKTHRLI
jgi:hypothetical protein